MTKQELGPRQQEWLDALRSGEYEQATCTLESAYGGFCCLGVACKVAEKHGVRINRERSGTKRVEGTSLEHQLPVISFFHFNPVPAGTGNSLGSSDLNLIEMNDSDKLSFEEIADLVEEDPSRAFSEPA